MASYAASKQPIYARCRVAVCNRDDPSTRPARKDVRVETVGLDAPSASDWGIVQERGVRRFARGAATLLDCDAVRLRGSHNEFNVLAALALAATRVSIDRDVLHALTTFEGLPHRCVTVAVVDGITFIDDSKATNLGACLAALEGLGDAARKHIVLIAGGDAKGADLSPLGEPVGRFVHHVITLGRDAERVERAIGATPHRRVGDMDEAVAAARGVARPGDLVLLSPACSSLDMFRNYEARGAEFSAAVQRLIR
jgi:UDP-N-acetylmuramoylalanine--D-glutamate ligase